MSGRRKAEGRVLWRKYPRPAITRKLIFPFSLENTLASWSLVSCGTCCRSGHKFTRIMGSRVLQRAGPSQLSWWSSHLHRHGNWLFTVVLFLQCPVSLLCWELYLQGRSADGVPPSLSGSLCGPPSKPLIYFSGGTQW